MPPEPLPTRRLRQWPGSAGQLLRTCCAPRSQSWAHVCLLSCLCPDPRRGPFFWSENPEGGIRRNPYSAGCTHFLPYRRCSGESGVPGGREHVGLLWVRRVAEPGRNQGGPSSRTNILTPSGQKVASLRCESWVRLGPRRSPSLLRPFASLFPRIPGYAAAHRTPTHSLCSLDCRDCGCSACSATQPASSWLPLLALGSAPGVFPRRSSAGLPSLRCLPTPCRAVGGQPGS